ncbi:MAG: YbjQ family protein [Acidimicrobiales bacterium]
MFMTTTATIEGHPITETLGMVQGSTIRSKDIGRDIGASLKSIVGGELRSYTQMLVEARQEAVQRMTEHATSMGANAIVGVRFTTSMVMGGAAEILAYGTAVKI